MAQTESSGVAGRRQLAIKFLASLVFTVVLLEIALRLVGFAPAAPPPVIADLGGLPIRELVDHAHRSKWIHEPSSREPMNLQGEHPDVTLVRNWCGCREDDETPVEKLAGVQRIVVLGDSHTDGIVDNRDSYANVLERSLGAGHDVVNCGQGVTSPYQQLWIYRVLYSRFEPDRLVVGFYAGNDLVELTRQHDRIHLEWDGRRFVHCQPTRRPDVTMEWYGTGPFLRRHLATVHVLQRIGWIGPPSRPIRARRDSRFNERIQSARDRFPAATWQGLGQAHFFKHFPDEWENALAMLRHVVKRFQQESPGGDIVFAVIPTLRQLHPEVVGDAAEVLELEGQDLECDDRVCEAMLAICRELNVEAIDLRPAMRRETTALFWDFDHHINVAGHRIIARELESHMSRAVVGRSSR